jgi:RNA-binding protein YlmH
VYPRVQEKIVKSLSQIVGVLVGTQVRRVTDGDIILGTTKICLLVTSARKEFLLHNFHKLKFSQIG